MNVFFSPSTNLVVWSDGKDSIVSQLSDSFEKERDIHSDPVDEETMLTLSVCRVVTDWERRDGIESFADLAPIDDDGGDGNTEPDMSDNMLYAGTI